MKKIASYGLVVLFVFASVGLAVPASAAGPKVRVKVDREVVRSGQTFTVTASASTRCQWLVRWNGERRVRTGKRFTGVFTAPAVTGRVRLPVSATCFYTPEGVRPPPTASTSGTAERVTVYVPERQSGAGAITVLPPRASVSPPQPPHDPGPDGLPNTGGPVWLLLLAGMTSLLGGIVILRRTAQRVER